MKIYFKHYSGAITEYDYLFFDCMAEVGPLEEDEALAEGWLPDDYHLPKHGKKADWYQARQTRIDLIAFEDDRRTKKARKKCKDVTVKEFSANTVNLDILNNIFKKYIEYRNFKNWDLEPLIELEKERKYFLLYYYEDKPVAFTFMRDVGTDSVFSTQFAWDYENSKLYLGKYANLAEIDYCIRREKRYMYLGMGYEETCKYKADYKGFEFWNGEFWSPDVEHYKWLCERDSKIKHTKDLDEIKEHDDKNFFLT